MGKTLHSQSNKTFKIIIVLLTILLLLGVFYIYKMSAHSKDVIFELRNEKSDLEVNLEKVKASLEETINSKSHLSKELIAEKNKIDKLLKALKRGDITKKEIESYKISIKNLELRVGYLMNEIENYKKQIDSTKVELINSKTSNEALQSKNKNLNEQLEVVTTKIKSASKLSFYNLEVNTFRTRNSGALVATQKASRIELIKTSFIIGENELVPSEKKQFFIQIIDPKNNIIGPNNTTSFGEKILDYSAIADVKYEKKSIKIEKDIPVQDLIEGIYVINVYDQSSLILKSTLELK